MDYSRRDLGLLLAAQAAAQAQGQNKILESKALKFEDMAARSNGPMRSRAILKGETHGSLLLDLHETELDAGQAPHEPHRHVHEELLMIRTGTLDITIAGQTTRLGAGSVAYIASNELHGWRNSGATAAEYFVLALGVDG